MIKWTQRLETILLMSVSLICMFIAIKEVSYVFGFFAIVFAWQLGWGMNLDDKIKELEPIVDFEINEESLKSLEKELKETYPDSNFMVSVCNGWEDITILYDNKNYMNDLDWLDDVFKIAKKHLEEGLLWSIETVYDLDGKIKRQQEIAERYVLLTDEEIESLAEFTRRNK